LTKRKNEKQWIGTYSASSQAVSSSQRIVAVLHTCLCCVGSLLILRSDACTLTETGLQQETDWLTRKATTQLASVLLPMALFTFSQKVVASHSDDAGRAAIQTDGN
jgi:hypothetical protein